MAAKQEDDVLARLKSERGEEVVSGVRAIRARLGRVRGPELRRAIEALCSLFYIDSYDRPDLVPAIDAAVEALGRAGRRVIPILIEQFQGSDIKSHMHLAQVFGLMGAEAVPALRGLLAGGDPYARSFALYALGKVRHPSAAQALPEILATAFHQDKEVRDSAARVLGKIAEAVPPARLSVPRRRAVYETLDRLLSDEQAPVRAKAIRSLGKMAGAGLLTVEQIEAVVRRARGLLGKDESYNWDQAYIVRHEAEEALKRIESSSVPGGRKR